jgi:hypothetical protein
MKLLIVIKLLGTHKTGTAMLAYLYDVVKPLKSIFFFFSLYAMENTIPKKTHASNCQQYV